MLSDQQLARLHAIATICAEPGMSEYDVYGLVTEAVILYKVPLERFVIFPQIFMHWKPRPRAKHRPKDRRGEIPDFGFGHYN